MAFGQLVPKLCFATPLVNGKPSSRCCALYANGVSEGRTQTEFGNEEKTDRESFRPLW